MPRITPRSKRAQAARPTPITDLRLTVSGYKAIRESATLRIAPLTVISGANSSGKSSFMQPFLLMKQTLDSTFDPGPLLLHGPNVRVTNRSQVLSRGSDMADVSGEFTAGMTLGDTTRVVTFGAGGTELTVESDRITAPDLDVVLSDPMDERQIAKLEELVGDQAKSFSKMLGSTDEQNRLDAGKGWAVNIDRDRCFYNVSLGLKMRGDTISFGVRQSALDDTRWRNLLGGIIHVPGLRGNPERVYSRSAVGETYPGTFDTYVASIVYDWTNTAPEKLTQLTTQLEELGLTWRLVARRIDDASIELMVGRTPHGDGAHDDDVVSVADVGFGVSQILPVLVALIAARRGQIVFIEQPEIHLHPRAQLGLAKVLVEAAARGVRVITETHSSLVIRGIQTAVAEKQLKSDDLSLNWFGRDPETGFQTVTSASVDAAGRFGEWPVDFDDVSRDADWAFLDAVEARS